MVNVVKLTIQLPCEFCYVRSCTYYAMEPHPCNWYAAQRLSSSFCRVHFNFWMQLLRAMISALFFNKFKSFINCDILHFSSYCNFINKNEILVFGQRSVILLPTFLCKFHFRLHPQEIVVIKRFASVRKYLRWNDQRLVFIFEDRRGIHFHLSFRYYVIVHNRTYSFEYFTKSSLFSFIRISTFPAILSSRNTI